MGPFRGRPQSEGLGWRCRARPQEWQCPGRPGAVRRGAAAFSSDLRASGPASSPSVSWTPPDTMLGSRKGASRPWSKCHCPCFFPIIMSLRDNYEFTFCSAQSFIRRLRGRPGCQRRIDVCFRVAGVTSKGPRTQPALVARAACEPRCPHHLACVDAPAPLAMNDFSVRRFLFPYLATETSNILLEKMWHAALAAFSPTSLSVPVRPTPMPALLPHGDIRKSCFPFCHLPLRPDNSSLWLHENQAARWKLLRLEEPSTGRLCGAAFRWPRCIRPAEPAAPAGRRAGRSGSGTRSRSGCQQMFRWPQAWAQAVPDVLTDPARHCQHATSRPSTGRTPPSGRMPGWEWTAPGGWVGSLISTLHVCGYTRMDARA